MKVTRKKSIKKQNSQTIAQQQDYGKSAFDYTGNKVTANKSQRRRQIVFDEALNKIFQEVLERMSKDDASRYFEVVPSSKHYPTYAKIIEKPIAMREMRNKTKRMDYKSKEAFLGDIELMVNNAKQFNPPINGEVQLIVRHAEGLLKIALDAMEARKDDIATLEGANNPLL